jgi:hypothetical protein
MAERFAEGRESHFLFVGQIGEAQGRRATVQLLLIH